MLIVDNQNDQIIIYIYIYITFIIFEEQKTINQGDIVGDYFFRQGMEGLENHSWIFNIHERYVNEI